MSFCSRRGPITGLGHAAWLKKHIKSNHSGGEASKKNRVTRMCKLRRTAEREHANQGAKLRTRAPLCKLRQRGTFNNSELTRTLEKKLTPNFSMSIRNVTSPICPNCRTGLEFDYTIYKAIDGLRYLDNLTANQLEIELHGTPKSTVSSGQPYLTTRPTMNPRIQVTLNWACLALSAVGMQHNVNKVAPMTFQMSQGT